MTSSSSLGVAEPSATAQLELRGSWLVLLLNLVLHNVHTITGSTSE